METKLKKKFVQGAIGDSISTGFNAQGFGDNHPLSWTTGGSGVVKSHASRLRELLPNQEVVTVNHAVSGARSDQLGQQVSRVTAAGTHLDYATILIGTNDLMQVQMNSAHVVDQLYHNTREAIEQLLSHSHQLKILLVGIPDLLHLSSLLLESKFGSLARGFLGQGKLNGLHDLFLPRWRAANAGLRGLQAEFPTSVRFNDAVSQTAFERAHVSMLDFFHPSTEGQKLLAELTWHPEWILAERSSQS